jgi:membrane protein DedA with SNARE-associated domain
VIDFHSKRARWIAAVVLIFAMLSTGWFALRTYRSFLLLRSAYELGVPAVSNMRGWMTLHYVAATYRIPLDALIARLDLPPSIDPDLTARDLGERAGMGPFEYVQRMQRAVVQAAPPASPARDSRSSGWFGIDTDAILSALLVYGYPALALVLFFGAIGLPVPTGLATTLAGSLAGSGRLDWVVTSAVAIAASVAGDVVGYGIGRWLGQEFLERRGRWFGFTPARRMRVQGLFDRWGGLTVLITRTLVSHLSSVVSLLAGISRYRLAGFLAFAVLGRGLWTAAYLGLGYAAGNDVEAASGFLANLSGLLVSGSVLAVSALILGGAIDRRGSAPVDGR